jgi:hypothetical protein
MKTGTTAALLSFRRSIEVAMAGISHCNACNRPLRAVALFCSTCRQAMCCWQCYLDHRTHCPLQAGHVVELTLLHADDEARPEAEQEAASTPQDPQA